MTNAGQSPLKLFDAGLCTCRSHCATPPPRKRDLFGVISISLARQMRLGVM